MPHSTVVYTCSNCDAQTPRWVGRCSQCGKFGTVGTEGQAVTPTTRAKSGAVAAETVNLGSFTNVNAVRFASGFGEVDRVLGGGVAQGSVMLLTGEPGVGKSTLLLALLAVCGQAALYASGEESAEQVAGRLQRLGLKGDKIAFTTVSDAAALAQAIRQQAPRLVVVDSLQTMSHTELESGAGSPAQARAVVAELIEAAKQTKAAIIIIGHVTKEGVAAGPKTIEHLVDVVLSLEGSPHQPLRFLRALKNRFGQTDEVGVFQMAEQGLLEVTNPSELFLAERHHGAGSCITAVLEGSRSLLIELQALVTHSRLAYPKRATTGFDPNRLQVLLAVLSERAGVKLNFSDVYINLAGGFKSKEPSLDLAVAAAVSSAALKKTLPQDLVVFGEVGLGGEVRPVVGAERRLQEAYRLGFKQALVPNLPATAKLPVGLELVPVRSVAEAIDWLRH
ncbi:MAG: DNA repair protein RadA [Candidatus Veblenbacteria bacterium]|nr:DNA repair protein RadA [Candidatus Veblenbacteria bacterium]